MAVCPWDSLLQWTGALLAYSCAYKHRYVYVYIYICIYVSMCTYWFVFVIDGHLMKYSSKYLCVSTLEVRT